jgi:hypothetical protein
MGSEKRKGKPSQHIADLLEDKDVQCHNPNF